MIRWFGFLALATCALAHAGQDRTTFTVSVTITGPGLPVSRQPLWPQARVLREDADRRFLLVPGTPAQAKSWALKTFGDWRWQGQVSTEQWDALAHTPDGCCMRVQALPVIGGGLTRVQTKTCGHTAKPQTPR